MLESWCDTCIIRIKSCLDSYLCLFIWELIITFCKNYIFYSKHAISNYTWHPFATHKVEVLKFVLVIFQTIVFHCNIYLNGLRIWGEVTILRFVNTYMDVLENGTNFRSLLFEITIKLWKFWLAPFTASS